MPNAERMLSALRGAVNACRNTPGRKGSQVQIDADDVLVAGDLHGNLPHFQALLALADLPNQPRRHLVLQEVIHGPFLYPNGTDKSHQLLDLTAALKCQFPERVHFLPGNHELAQMTARPIARSRGELNSLFRAGIDVAYGDQSDEIYRAYLDFIRAAPLALRTSNRVFMSHSLPPRDRLAAWKHEVITSEPLQDTELLPGGSVYWLLWGRDLAPETVHQFLINVDADLLVSGHIPCEEGFLVPNDRQVVLDAQNSPGGYCLFPANRPITHQELAACVQTL
ncbi:MAG: metallophosphoesterase [Gemmataceae bacterium]